LFIFSPCSQEEDLDSDISIAGSGEDDDDDDGGISLEDEDEELQQDEFVAEEEDAGAVGQDSIVIIMLCKLIMYFQVMHSLSESVIRTLLLIVSTFLAELAKIYTPLGNISKAFPSSVHRFRKVLGFDRDHFQRYVMCPSCGTLYILDDIKGPSRITQCTQSWVTVALPNQIRKTCRAPLIKEVLMADGKVKIYPLKTFCYNSIIEVLKQMMKRKHFFKKCTEWKTRVSPSNFMTDIYDGRIWQSFFGDGGKYPGENYFGFLLNVDWFQPYKRRSVSIGAIYLCCVNLPREERYKKENIIVVGIIPSMANGGEPSNINSILDPLVEDLKRLFVGVEFETFEKEKKTCYGLLIGCSSDIPANRKLCGFLSHAAIKGCSRCYKEFKSFTNNRHKRNYSGFDEVEWNGLKRTNVDHRQKVRWISRQANGTKDRLQKETECGLRYSKLLDLPYFDPVRFCLIDPMHNLFLGTAKRMFTLWLDSGILSVNSLNTLKLRIERLKIPTDIGRIPSNIASNYSRFTAEEWKNWTMYYSPFVLRDMLEEAHYNCWQKFVLACTLMCKPFITPYEIRKAHGLFFAFGTHVQRLYGREVITPNMHMHGHLADCVLDYGPVQAFWCFAFERFNGAISDLPTNRRSIAVQYMHRILTWNSLNTDHDDGDMFTAIAQPDRVLINFCATISLITSFEGLISIPGIQNLSTIKFFGKPKMYVLTEDDIGFLEQMYFCIYGDERINNVSYICDLNVGLTIGHERFGSKSSKRASKNANVIAVWCAEDGSILNTAQVNETQFRPGKIQYFLTHTMEMNGTKYKHILACVRWFQKPRDRVQAGVHLFDDNATKPISNWKETFVPAGPASFIPVQRISSKCAIVSDTVKNIVYVCPLQRRF
tara:strand:- start:147 stop:2789 length:2643 start_codon:yes stop_codon:yes gene_type:complete